MKHKIKIKIGIMMLLMLSSVAISSKRYFFALLLSVTLHELGHVFAARLRKVRFSELKLGIFGASLLPSNSLFSYKDEIIICAGGPLMNFISVLFAIHFLKIPFSSIFIQSSMAAGILNLMPIISFDGGRILSSLLLCRCDPDRVTSIMQSISFVFLFAMWVFSLYILLRRGASLTVFIFCAAMFAKIFFQKKE